MSDLNHYDKYNIIDDMLKRYETGEIKENEVSEAELGFRDMNARFLDLEKSTTIGMGQEANKEKWDEIKKSHEKRKKLIEESWHKTTEAGYRELKTHGTQGKKEKEKSFYSSFTLENMEVFIKNSDRGSNSDSYNQVATDLELYNRIKADGVSHEALKLLINIDQSCSEYLGSHKNTITPKGKKRKAMIAALYDKVHIMIEDQRTAIINSVTEAKSKYDEDPSDENLDLVFRSSVALMQHFLNDNITLTDEQRTTLDNDMTEYMERINKRKVADTQNNNCSSKFFNALGWSDHVPEKMDDDEFDETVKNTPHITTAYHTINNTAILTNSNSLPNEIFIDKNDPEDVVAQKMEGQKKYFENNPTALPMVKQLAGVGEGSNQQYYSDGLYGKGTYLAVPTKYDNEEIATLNDCWKYGQNLGSMQVKVFLNKNARIISSIAMNKYEKKIKDNFGKLHDFIVNSEPITRPTEESDKEYLTMLAALLGYNTINSGPSGGFKNYKGAIEPDNNFLYFVTTDRSALTMKKTALMRNASYSVTYSFKTKNNYPMYKQSIW